MCLSMFCCCAFIQAKVFHATQTPVTPTIMERNASMKLSLPSRSTFSSDTDAAGRSSSVFFEDVELALSEVGVELGVAVGERVGVCIE